ncbi:hypothetical protein NEOLI_004897 [Neolecta irregularis DAH-3]|uniref:Uncharacterized protein n=1 Tax=Neolecta irregularis (strain DAH-3) TaxID=1198029 RepID=A0A1U7LKY9_NEOID|nr:hypothetical protein NEOLI_004897 [Neolecta irregularis DAH-3]|eukprot:OLL23325.1 hypothetical protein NEOLI_004897 [Neolecta irregularis DAH-3]
MSSASNPEMSSSSSSSNPENVWPPKVEAAFQEGMSPPGPSDPSYPPDPHARPQKDNVQGKVLRPQRAHRRLHPRPHRQAPLPQTGLQPHTGPQGHRPPARRPQLYAAVLLR